jgi:hypothetical protein
MAVVGTAALVAATTSAVAAFDPLPLPDVKVSVKKDPGGTIMRTLTDGSGSFPLGTLAENRLSVDFDYTSLGKAISKIDPKKEDWDHIIAFHVFDLSAGQKLVFSKEQPVPRGAGQNVSMPFTISGDPGGPTDKKKHSYKGIVTLVR